ncbi:hypothetical protein [Hoylesella loescheii]|jgi:hypothetical protein|uniref:hypothetical protein n=1 Tax=Hoylesella loescheii TaxID=840 RepID=UPI00248EB4BB|nr:hypothetical protein [Hoylesella loescheii]
MKKTSLLNQLSLLFLAATTVIVLCIVLTHDTITPRLDVEGGTDTPITSYIILPYPLVSGAAYLLLRYLSNKAMQIKVNHRRQIIPLTEHNAPLIRNLHDSMSFAVTGAMLYATLLISGIIPLNAPVTVVVFACFFGACGSAMFKLMREKEMQQP